MGTRHLVCVVQDGDYKVAQYGQFDGYPSGCGETLIEWLTTPGNVRRLADGVARSRGLSADEANALISERRSRGDSDPMGQFGRGLSAGILEYVASDAEPLVYADPGFAGDSLMCEWAYVIDLDACRFEVFKGFNKQTLAENERFAGFDVPEPAKEMGYQPVKHLVSYDFSELTADTPEKIEALLDNE